MNRNNDNLVEPAEINVGHFSFEILKIELMMITVFGQFQKKLNNKRNYITALFLVSIMKNTLG